MNDEELLSGPSVVGPALLRAGRDEWPSDEALKKALAAVGVGAAVIAASTAAAGAGAGTSAVAKSGAVLVSFGSVMKWLGIGVVSGVVVAGVAHEVSSPSAPPRANIAAAPPVAVEPKHAYAKPRVAPAPPAVVTPEPERTVPAPRAVSERAEEPEHVPLAAEVALVDRARALLASGNSAGALSALTGYETAFAEQRLEPEVLFVRMEAYLAAGDATRARRTAEESLRRFPRSPHAARARDVLDQGVEKK